jgi:hypothetical protein
LSDRSAGEWEGSLPRPARRAASAQSSGTSVLQRPYSSQRFAEKPVPGRHAALRQPERFLWRHYGLLAGVLVIQAALSLRLIWANTAFNDEALYMWAGRLELQHLEHGVVIQPFQTYFSGAPVIYPPLAALADDAGGLAGVRLLSLVFMLGATLLTYGVTRRLFDPTAGLIAAAVFAATGPVQFIGSFATYDAMALFLLALAAWLVIMARGRLSEPLLILGAAVLVLANATKYPSALWDPVVILLAGLTAADRINRPRQILRSARFGLYTALGLGAALAGGRGYRAGVLFTTLARHSSTVPATSVLRSGALWVGLIFVIALRGVVIASSRRQQLLMLTLAGAVALAPLEQARIHTMTSLDKHAAFGAWFGAIAVGFVLAQAMRTSKYMGWRIPAGTAAVMLLFGITQSYHFFHNWPDSRPAVAAIARAQGSSTSPILAEQGPVAAYYLGLPDYRLYNTLGFGYWDHRELTGTPAYTDAIRHHYFSVIEIDFSLAARNSRDTAIVNAVRHNPGYRLVGRIPWSDNSGHRAYLIWRRVKS